MADAHTTREQRRGIAGRWGEALRAPIDIASLVYFRVIFGAIMVWEVWRYFDHGWIRAYWIDPVFHFTYAGFRWLEPWPGDWMFFHMLALGVLAAFIMVGFLYRLSTALFFLGFSYIFLLEKARYLNHFYFIILIAFLLMFLPAHRAFSVDACIWPRIKARMVPAWTLWSLRAQLGIVYFFGGVAKLNADWLRGEPVGIWLSGAYYYLHEQTLVGPYLEYEWFIYGIAYGGLLFDLLVVPMLLWKRTRWLAFLAAAVFHVMNAWFFQIGIFPWLSLGATAIFFRPDWPRSACGWLFKGKETAPKGKQAGVPGSRWARPILALMAVHFLFQCLLPLRHYLYPGNVNWTEEGHRFAWHMKLRSKDARTAFFARDPTTGAVYEIDSRERLTSWQERKMTGRPDMILEFARYIASEMEENGIPGAEVYVRSEARLNGRRAQVFVDPDVNLAVESWGIRPTRWVRPLTEPLRPEPAEDSEEPAGDNFIRPAESGS